METVSNFFTEVIRRGILILVAALLLAAWALTGPLFYLSDLWREHAERKEEDLAKGREVENDDCHFHGAVFQRSEK